ncbi:MAG TPA: Hsp20/alpha crystallin family protein [Candidatus Sulfotelmatobacter sp.]|jgi:HSP20 family protein|nr:Hsp20/alpha crystallin family protein [Candidatus Sulfotelmatobacter sp.]
MADLARRNNIFNELFDFRRDFDGLFNRLVMGSSSSNDLATANGFVPPIEVRFDNQDNKYHMRVALPGVEPNEIQINLQGNRLTISGEHKSDQEKKESDYMHREFSFERFERTIVLPENLDTEHVNAEFNNGMLEITVPVSAAALPKKIEVKNVQQAQNAQQAKSQQQSANEGQARSAGAGTR